MATTARSQPESCTAVWRDSLSSRVLLSGERVAIRQGSHPGQSTLASRREPILGATRETPNHTTAWSRRSLRKGIGAADSELFLSVGLRENEDMIVGQRFDLAVPAEHD